MKHTGLKSTFAVFISLLALASLACSLTNRIFQSTPAATPKVSPSKTGLEPGSNPTRKFTPTHKVPAAFLKLSASPADTDQNNSNRLATITPLPGPTEETGYDPDMMRPTEFPEPGKVTATRTKTPVPGTPSTPTKSPLPGTPFTATNAANATATLTNAPNPTSTTVSSCGSTYNHPYESDLLDWINTERLAQGLAAYTRSKQLDMAALRHSLDMACTTDWFDQKGSDGSTIYDRIIDAGYDYGRADQTIYAATGISDNPKSAFDTWKSLPTSKSILFDNGYTDIGIGYVNNPNSTYGGYFTAVFAQP